MNKTEINYKTELVPDSLTTLESHFRDRNKDINHNCKLKFYRNTETGRQLISDEYLQNRKHKKLAAREMNICVEAENTDFNVLFKINVTE